MTEVQNGIEQKVAKETKVFQIRVPAARWVTRLRQLFSPSFNPNSLLPLLSSVQISCYLWFLFRAACRELPIPLFTGEAFAKAVIQKGDHYQYRAKHHARKNAVGSRNLCRVV
jgi:hypothetical protein